jgi:hypothetical protein|tara:strand:+ start:393 stop:827 length:435 start_codon:yes stop_codon:yes gene_type:complete
MKSNIEKVYSKLPKTELATQKVELGVADDISKAVTDAKTVLKELKDSNAKTSAADKSLVQTIKSAIKEANKIDDKDAKLRSAAGKKTMKYANVLDKAEKAAKDLGVQPTGIDGFLELEKLYVDIEDEADETFMWTDLEPLVRGI